MDASKVPALVDAAGYPVLLAAYDSVPVVRGRICEIHSIDDAHIFGTQMSTLLSGLQLKRRLDGAQIEDAEVVAGPTAMIANGLYSRSLTIPERMWRAADAVGAIGNQVAAYAQMIGENAQMSKEQLVADVLQKGTLTAGDTAIFDGSRPGYPDPNRGFIFDGMPFFDTAHPQTVGGNTFSNHDAANALTSANLTTAKVRMSVTNAFDAANNRVMIRPTTLVVPTALEATARVLLESQTLPGSANNDINIHRGTLELISWALLSDDADAWWLNAGGKGIRFNDSGAPTMRVVFEEGTKSFRIFFETAFGCAVNDWRTWYCANKAAA